MKGARLHTVAVLACLLLASTATTRSPKPRPPVRIDPARLEALVDYYKPQVEHYARFWSKLTGAKTHAGLFFVDGPTMKWV